jgi:hypothetical protein
MVKRRQFTTEASPEDLWIRAAEPPDPEAESTRD